MKVNSTYNFFFHPLEKQHSPVKKIVATITIIALTIFTGFLYLIPFLICNIRDRSVKPVEKKTMQSKIEDLKSKHTEQIKQFEQWAQNGDWRAFEVSHYDWWVFPIMRSSRGYGDRFAISATDITTLKNDLEFMENYRRGVKLVIQSWGWDLDTDKPVVNKSSNQRWIGYGVRLGKMADSLKLFGEEKLYKKLQLFAKRPDVLNTVEPWVRRSLAL